MRIFQLVPVACRGERADEVELHQRVHVRAFSAATSSFDGSTTYACRTPLS